MIRTTRDRSRVGRRLGAAKATALTIAVLCMAGCAAQNKPVASSELPQRIVSLGPSSTKQLYLLGAADRVVGITKYCPILSEGPTIAKVGSVVDPSVEVIVGLQPDLVLATSLTNERRLQRLRSLQLPVVTLPTPASFLDICEQFRYLGNLVGATNKAENIIAAAQERATAVTTRVANRPRPSVFIQIGARPLFTADHKSFLNDLIEVAGGSNIARDATACMYSRESVVASNPDHILILTMGLTGQSELDTWRQFKVLTAVQNDNIHVIDSERICSPDPANFVEVLEEVAEIFHPQPGTETEQHGTGDGQ